MEYEAQMTSIQEEHRVALERQLIALTGSVEEQRAMIEAKAKEERIEILHRQAMRRILNKDIANGFAAWQELWSAKTYARDKLRECANRLHAPELANTYRRWESDWRKEMAGAEIAALAQQVAGLSGEGAAYHHHRTLQSTTHSVHHPCPCDMPHMRELRTRAAHTYTVALFSLPPTRSSRFHVRLAWVAQARVQISTRKSRG